MVLAMDDDILQEAIDTQFECARCGQCCKGEGIVRFGPAMADRMARALGLKRQAFIDRFAVVTGPEQYWLQDRLVDSPYPDAPPETWCVFLQRTPDGLFGCRLYQAKPDQCRRFPAKWRNPDSLRTCVGLRRLVARLRRATPE